MEITVSYSWQGSNGEVDLFDQVVEVFVLGEMRLQFQSRVIVNLRSCWVIVWINPFCRLNITNQNMPENTQKVWRGEDDDNQPENLIDLNQHQCLKNWIWFALNIIFHRSLEDLIIMVIDRLLDPVNIEKL